MLVAFSLMSEECTIFSRTERVESCVYMSWGAIICSQRFSLKRTAQMSPKILSALFSGMAWSLSLWSMT